VNLEANNNSLFVSRNVIFFVVVVYVKQNTEIPS